MPARVPAGVLAALLLVSPARAADPPLAALHLADGGRVTGRLTAHADPNALRWQSPAFARPLEFPLGGVRAVRYPAPPQVAKPVGGWSVELANGDLLFGDLVAVTGEMVEVATPHAGRVTLRPATVRRLLRRPADAVVYAGPNGLAGWAAGGPAGGWKEDGGDLVADQLGASLFADLGLPPRAALEVGLAWRGKPDFVLALGVDNDPKAARRGFRLEAWDGELVAVGESGRDADLAVVGPAAVDGEARVRLLLDQPARKLTVLSPEGGPLATLAVTGTDPPKGGVRLTNGSRSVRLTFLRVDRWDGRPPPAGPADRPWVGRTDGTVVFGRVTGYDPAAKRFTVRDGDTETVVPEAAVADVHPGGGAAVVGPPVVPPARVVLHDGTRVSGRPAGVSDTHLSLDAGAGDPVRLPLAAVRSVTLPRTGDPPAAPTGGRPGRLEADGVLLRGRLVGAGDAAGQLVWRPDLGQTASPLAGGFAGTVVYRERGLAPVRGAPQPVAGQPARRVVVLGNVNQPAPARPTAARLPVSGRPTVHLRAGDSVPGEVTRIDERGVTLKSPSTAVTFIPHDRIKGVELAGGRDLPGLDESKWTRLMTLPRSQRGDPPTHLVCAKTGDVLRGRLVGLDDANVQVEIGGETRSVPRDRVAQVVWLHPEELSGKPPAPAAGGSPAAAPAGVRVQAVRPDGGRLTFTVAASDGTTLAGTGDVLGPCRVAVADVDQLLIGAAIDRSGDLAYSPWKLRAATDPKSAQPADAGTESPLVGQPAPPFELATLAGGPFKLADRKGTVVVLDFWASWCGPCLASLPETAAVAKEFAGQGVELLAVNLEETADRAKATVERQKWAVPVALDRDGAVAAKYGVSSIPQVVVVGRDGRVAYLHTGADKGAADALRTALKAAAGK